MITFFLQKSQRPNSQFDPEFSLFWDRNINSVSTYFTYFRRKRCDHWCNTWDRDAILVQCFFCWDRIDISVPCIIFFLNTLLPLQNNNLLPTFINQDVEETVYILRL